MNSHKHNSFELLKNKKIYEILDGDTKYEDYEFRDGATISISMPYLSGPDICSLAAIFGYPMEYTNLSRWQYFEDFFNYCIQESKCSELLKHLFSEKHFSRLFPNYLGVDEIKEAYEHFSNVILDKINGLLFYGGNKLVVLGNQFLVKRVGSKIEIEAPRIKSIDREYVKSISSRALNDIEQGNFDSAITKARTLVEEIFCYVIEKKMKNLQLLEI